MQNTIKKITFIVWAVFFISVHFSQTVRIEHKYYTTHFSTKAHIPLVVTYTLNKNMLSCKAPVKRTNRFKPDPQLKKETSLADDYRNSGYDRGHNMNAADNKCSETGMEESFYYSNMTPQPHAFNAGVWGYLEELERKITLKYNKVLITTGSVGKTGDIGKNHVVIPKFMWKVIYVPSLKKYLCFLFKNDEGTKGPLNQFKAELEEIENLANVIFKNGNVELE